MVLKNGKAQKSPGIEIEIDPITMNKSESDPVHDDKWIHLSDLKVASKHHSDLMIYPLTLMPYSMAQGVKYLIKDTDHAQLPGVNECALIQEGNSSFQMTCPRL